MKPVRLRQLAEEDLVEQARWYAQDGGRALGERFFDAALAALEPIARMPGVGSLRLGERCDIPGLRSWGVTGFPYRWLYFERIDHSDVIRLLGERQDIDTLLGDTP